MTFGKRVLFLFGQVGVMCLVRFFLQWILAFADKRQAGEGGGEALFVAAAVGTVFFVARVADAGLDPLVGGWSDGYVARGKERRRLLAYTFFLAPAGLALAFAPTFGMAPAMRWALLVPGFALFFFGYTAYGIPLWSLVDDYGGDDGGERSILSNLLGAGTLLAVALVSVGAGLVERFGHGVSAVMLGCIAAPLMFLAYFSRPKNLPVSRLSSEHAHTHAGIRAMLETLKDKRFVAVLILFSGSQMALTVVSAAAPFVASRLLGGTDKDVSKLLGPFLGTAIPCFALVPAFARKLGWERAMVVASVGLSVVYLGVAFLGSSIVGSPMTTAMILFGCGGPMVAVLLGLESEAVARSARASDSGRVSLYFGMFNLCVKALNGLAVLLTSALVTLSDERPDLARLATRAMGAMAAVLLFAGVGIYFVVRPRGDRA